MFKVLFLCVFMLTSGIAAAAQAAGIPALLPTPAATPAAMPSKVPVAVPTAYVRPNARYRFRHFVDDLTGLTAWGGLLGSAAISTATNEPDEWGGTWEGFGKRVASNFGRNAIRSTVTYGLDEALKLDSHFYKSEKRTVGARIKNALISPVTARKANGKRTIGVPKIVGAYSANVIAYELWYPARYDWKDGMRNGSISIAANAAYNLVKEFIFKK